MKTNNKKEKSNAGKSLAIGAGNYYLTVSIMNENATAVLSYKPKALEFRIKKETQLEGVAFLESEWVTESV